jgi:hypothetical protein
VKQHGTTATPIIHQTDLFDPPADPDDFWDLACVASFGYGKEFDVKGIVIDYPPGRVGAGDPAVASVAQLNYIAGLAAPVVVGSRTRLREQREAPPGDRAVSECAAVAFVARTLAEATAAVKIFVVGSCRDIAKAAVSNPALFAEKCAGIYLNAGVGVPDSDGKRLEYNTRLDPEAYAAMFSLPCPLYWCPCAGETIDQRDEHATYYHLKQYEVLRHVSPQVQRYFADAILGPTDRQWLDHLAEAPDAAAMDDLGQRGRNMWSTAGFIHAAGYGVHRDGKLIPFDPEASVFTFDPVTISCDQNGRTHWEAAEGVSNQFLFRVTDMARYQDAMIEAMKELLRRLP